MELRQYRYFVAVAEELSFTRAAQRLCMAQPPLSQQIAKMERELGVRLFHRDHRTVSLTPAGEALLGECYQLLEQERRTRESIGLASSAPYGRLRVAAMPSLFLGLLPAALRDIRSQYPDLEIRVEELDDADQLDRLARHQLDIGLGRQRGQTAGFTVTDLGQEPLLVALPATHRLARRRAAVALAELASEDFVMFRRSQAPSVHDTYLEACASAGFRMKVVEDDAVGEHSILGLVACGQGVALVPATTAQIRLPDVVFRRVVKADKAKVPVTLTWRERVVPPLAAEFTAALRRCLLLTATPSHPAQP